VLCGSWGCPDPDHPTTSPQVRALRELGTVQGFGVQSTWRSACSAGVVGLQGVSEAGAVSGILVPRCSAVRCDGLTSISKHLICDAD